jgi:diadenosine tetraphosphatase ApaH/serine/threonine PP2A family protein phosphatase
VVVRGHTHRQSDWTLDRWRVVNAGSVGMPYEGRAGAYWALLGPDVQLRHTELDVEAMGAAIRGTGYPLAEEMLRDCFVAPVDPDAVERMFEERVGS